MNNRLKLVELSNTKWDYIQQLITELNVTTFEEYHDVYYNIDFNVLADVFKKFCKTSIDDW